jgi:hypothetical protein
MRSFSTVPFSSPPNSLQHKSKGLKKNTLYVSQLSINYLSSNCLNLDSHANCLVYIVIWSLNAKSVVREAPQKTSIARQRLARCVSVETDRLVETKALLLN